MSNAVCQVAVCHSGKKGRACQLTRVVRTPLCVCAHLRLLVHACVRVCGCLCTCVACVRAFVCVCVFVSVGRAYSNLLASSCNQGCARCSSRVFPLVRGRGQAAFTHVRAYMIARFSRCPIQTSHLHTCQPKHKTYPCQCSAEDACETFPRHTNRLSTHLE